MGSCPALLLSVALLSGLASLPRAQAPKEAAAPKRVALVIGVNKYEKRGLDDLSFAENDAAELAATLADPKTYKFDRVVVLKGSGEGERRATCYRAGRWVDACGW
jgi:hypothetical protein